MVEAISIMLVSNEIWDNSSLSILISGIVKIVYVGSVEMIKLAMNLCLFLCCPTPSPPPPPPLPRFLSKKELMKQ